MNCQLKLTAVLVLCLLGAACAATPGKVTAESPVDEINNQGGLALKGYDPVAYFAEGRPVVGDPAISYRWLGANYRFSTQEHRQAFVQNPQRYAPQFGGYCAYAVSRGTTADGDPFQWAVVDEKLYVNNNALAAKLWKHDRPHNIHAGVVNWPLIAKQPLRVEPPGAPPTQETQ